MKSQNFKQSVKAGTGLGIRRHTQEYYFQAGRYLEKHVKASSRTTMKMRGAA